MDRIKTPYLLLIYIATYLNMLHLKHHVDPRIDFSKTLFILFANGVLLFWLYRALSFGCTLLSKGLFPALFVLYLYLFQGKGIQPYATLPAFKDPWWVGTLFLIPLLVWGLSPLYHRMGSSFPKDFHLFPMVCFVISMLTPLPGLKWGSLAFGGFLFFFAHRFRFSKGIKTTFAWILQGLFLVGMVWQISFAPPRVRSTKPSVLFITVPLRLDQGISSLHRAFIMNTTPDTTSLLQVLFTDGKGKIWLNKLKRETFTILSPETEPFQEHFKVLWRPTIQPFFLLTFLEWTPLKSLVQLFFQKPLEIIYENHTPKRTVHLTLRYLEQAKEPFFAWIPFPKGEKEGVKQPLEGLVHQVLQRDSPYHIIILPLVSPPEDLPFQFHPKARTVPIYTNLVFPEEPTKLLSEKHLTSTLMVMAGHPENTPTLSFMELPEGMAYLHFYGNKGSALFSPPFLWIHTPSQDHLYNLTDDAKLQRDLYGCQESQAILQRLKEAP